MRPLAFSVLLLSDDQGLQEKIGQTLDGFTVAMARDLASIPRSAVKQGFDAILIEACEGVLQEFSDVSRMVEPTRTMILMGSRSVLIQSAEVLRSMTSGFGRLPGQARREAALEDIIETKLSAFVKSMRRGSARDLHPMLISAVERPLIALALRETNGNQIQAAHLLGMNRNTLRKKITEFRIPVKRSRTSQTGAA
jgi:two-component system nitrogen regulation response regulator GlnG